jgi:iron complex outermembrane receptor protein
VAAAQGPVGFVSGRVFDPSRGVVPGASVAIGGKTITTGGDGRYVIGGLDAGEYVLAVFAPGFAPYSAAVVVGARSITRDVVLAVAAVEERVSVGAKAPEIALGSEAIASGRARTSDTASLLRDVPGLALYDSGGISSLLAIHGLADDRVNVLVDGMSIAPACANHMNPPSSYIDPANVGSVNVMAGITPVSAGGDSLGGTVAIEPAAPEFAGPGQGVVTRGGVSAFHRSNGVVNGGNASFSAATESLEIGYTGSYVNANDYKNGAGVMVKSTFYESQNHALRLAARRGRHLLTVDLGFQEIPQQGFVNARMDMTGNQAKFANVHYDGVFAWGTLDARVYYENTRHSMNILRDKIPGMNMPMFTAGANLGYSVKAEIPASARDTLRVGSEFHRFTLDDWWTPVMAMTGSMGPDTLWNVRNGRRYRLGTYVEWETRRGAGWTESIGVRDDVALMNTGDVAGYNMAAAATGSAAYYADATEFNSRDRHRLDNDFDATALARYEPRSTSVFEFGYARKTRAPSLYERYLWVKRSAMAASMNGWFGDGNAYTGNPDLRPEAANTLSASAGWHDAAKKDWELKITPYYTYVERYIDVDRCSVIADGSNGCTAARFAATTGFVTLQFANHDAELYGIDASGRMPLRRSAKLGDFSLSGVLGYVRGKNLDTGDNLYQIMPLNARLGLEHRRGAWSSAFDFQAVDAKNDVQAVRNELRAAGYALANFRTGYRWHLIEAAGLRLDAGIDNLGNRNYVLPLGGRYWIGDKTGNSPTPGMGRTFYSGLTFDF